MEQFKLGEMEQRFADLIWAQAPIQSGQLARLCEEAFGWKRTTSYTMLKRLCDRQIFRNSNGIVEMLMTKEEFQASQGESFIKEHFNGSLPQFLTAFTKKNKLDRQEIAELKKMIEEYEEGGCT